MSRLSGFEHSETSDSQRSSTTYRDYCRLAVRSQQSRYELSPDLIHRDVQGRIAGGAIWYNDLEREAAIAFWENKVQTGKNYHELNEQLENLKQQGDSMRKKMADRGHSFAIADLLVMADAIKLCDEQVRSASGELSQYLARFGEWCRNPDNQQQARVAIAMVNAHAENGSRLRTGDTIITDSNPGRSAEYVTLDVAVMNNVSDRLRNNIIWRDDKEKEMAIAYWEREKLPEESYQQLNARYWSLRQSAGNESNHAGTSTYEAASIAQRMREHWAEFDTWSRSLPNQHDLRVYLANQEELASYA